MRAAFSGSTAALVGFALGWLVSGCGPNITPDMTLAEAAGQIDLLSRITVGDLAAGFQEFAARLEQMHAGGMPPPLSPEQERQMQELQGRLDRGEITPEEFANQVQQILGDVAPCRAFGGFGFLGAPFPRAPAFVMAEQLGLTDAQREQARDIFRRLHEDIRSLRQDAHTRIRSLLTPEQLARLDELVPGPGGLPSHRGMGMHHRGPGPRPLFERLADELALNEDQLAQIEAIRAELRDAVRARHQAARDEFRGLLTPDQLAILDQLEARPE